MISIKNLSPEHRLITAIGSGLLAISIAIALPTDAETKLNLGNSEINLTAAKNALIVGMGAGYTLMCLAGIEALDRIEERKESEARQARLQLEAEQKRTAMAAAAQLNAEEAFHKAVAERSVQRAFAEQLQQESGVPVQQQVPALAAVGGQPVPVQSMMPEAGQAVPAQPLNFAEKLGANPKCFMILGVPGAGKAMVASNALRYCKQTKPHLTVVVVDPKNDPKEMGNYEGCADHVFRKRAEQLDNHSFLKWVKGIVEYFKKLPDGKLLIFDEITATFTRWARLDKQSFESFVVDYGTYLSSSGDSMENYVWFIGQVPHASVLGMDGGIRSIYKPVAIVSNQHRAATDTFLGTKWIPKPPGGKQEVYNIMDQSPRGRAVYDYIEDRWLPMPELKNYSGYDRDSRTHIQ